MQKIMFNDKFGLTKAVLEGKKTQTRRFIPNNHLVKNLTAPIISDDNFIKKYDVKFIGQDINLEIKELEVKLDYFSPSARYQGINARTTKMEQIPIQYLPEETVAVAQSYQNLWETDPDALVCTEGSQVETYIAKHYPGYTVEQINRCAGWKNKMFVKAEFMPHRIRITGIRLERLQDISNEDCLKEGIKKSWWMGASGKPLYGFENDDRYTSPREAYATLIDKISGKGTWEKNPWVFVYDFELVK